MELTLIRKFKGDTYTIGDLLLNGVFLCNTLEDTVRVLPNSCPNTPKGIDCNCSNKIKGKTAIPTGTYKVVLSYSNRFKKILPELLNVPHFLGIRIHSGNTAEDTEGCILVGDNLEKGKVLNSRIRYNELIEELGKDKDNINIEVK